MKLNNQQINALASKFFNELQVKYQKKNETDILKQIESFKPLYNKGFKLLNSNSFLADVSVIIKLGKSVTITRKTTFKDFSDSWGVRNSLKKQPITFNIDSIKQDIILATIDTSSIDEIMEVLTKKYK